MVSLPSKPNSKYSMANVQDLTETTFIPENRLMNTKALVYQEQNSSN